VSSHEALIFSWQAGSWLLPDLSGAVRFRLAPFNRTVVRIEGAYRPPFGPFGALFDRLIGRHIATATVRELVAEVAGALEEGEAAFRAAHPPAS
jgi:uncharacterized membrane protein